MPRKLRFSLASILCWITLLVLLLAGVKACPQMRDPNYPFLRDSNYPFYSEMAVWAALMHELAFLAITLAVVELIGSRTRYDFTLGFAVFAVTPLVV